MKHPKSQAMVNITSIITTARKTTLTVEWLHISVIELTRHNYVTKNNRDWAFLARMEFYSIAAINYMDTVKCCYFRFLREAREAWISMNFVTS